MRILTFPFFSALLLICASSCSKTTSSFSVQVRCLEDTEHLNLQVKNLKTNEEVEVVLDQQGRGDIENIQGKELHVTGSLREPDVPYVLYRFHREYHPSLSNGLELQLAEPVAIEWFSVEREDEGFKVRGLFERNRCLQLQSVRAYSSTTWPYDPDTLMPFFESPSFNGTVGNFEFPLPTDEPYYVVYEFSARNQSTTHTVRSYPIRASIADFYQDLFPGQKIDFEMSEEGKEFRLQSKADSLYILEFWDENNATQYTGSTMVLTMNDVITEARTAYPKGRGLAVYGSEQSMPVVSAKIAAEGNGGSFGIRLRHVKEAQSVLPVDTVDLTSPGEVRIFEFELEKGTHSIHMTELGDANALRGFATLFQSADLSIVPGVASLGPAAYFSQSFTREFYAPTTQSYRLVVHAGYEGEASRMVVTID